MQMFVVCMYVSMHANLCCMYVSMHANVCCMYVCEHACKCKNMQDCMREYACVHALIKTVLRPMYEVNCTSRTIKTGTNGTHLQITYSLKCHANTSVRTNIHCDSQGRYQFIG